jgi:hypothetical protein
LAYGSALVAGAALSAFEGTLSEGRTAAHVGVLVAIGLAFSVALAAGARRQLQPSLEWGRGPFALRRHLHEDRTASLGSLVWTLLVLGVVGWDLNSFARQSHRLPTLSTIFGHLSAHPAGRGALFFGWLVLGGALAVGWRRR